MSQLQYDNIAIFTTSGSRFTCITHHSALIIHRSSFTTPLPHFNLKLSLSVTVRLNTGVSGVEFLSAQKYPFLMNCK